MPVLDSRQLLFDEAAIIASLQSNNHVSRHLRLPASAVNQIYLSVDDQSVEVLHGGESTRPIIHRLTAAQMGALLIAYCIRSGIPVPRNCTKTIRIHQAQVALTFTNRIVAVN